MSKLFILAGSFIGAITVGIGAFGAHSLKNFLENAGRIDTFETAVKYQFYHVFALILLGIVMQKAENQYFTISGWLFLAGITIFSGSLYVLCFTGIRWLGAITPFGGLAMIGGWLFLAYGVWKTY
ncbi:MAG: DUF423 domain-containing protein [Cytophagales bacterium]